MLTSMSNFRKLSYLW